MSVIRIIKVIDRKAQHDMKAYRLLVRVRSGTVYDGALLPGADGFLALEASNGVHYLPFDAIDSVTPVWL